MKTKLKILYLLIILVLVIPIYLLNNYILIELSNPDLATVITIALSQLLGLLGCFGFIFIDDKTNP